MSNTEWYMDQVVGDKAERKFSEQRKADECSASLAAELRELLAAFVDSKVLIGHDISDAQWERACLLCGRNCPPFLEKKLKVRDSLNGKIYTVQLPEENP
jgi:hypothetical protein